MYSDLPIETLELALSFLDANCGRDEWVTVGMAVKAELGEDGFSVWDTWSSRADNYSSKDARDTWRSIRAGGGVTVATLIHMAKQAGYRPDAQPKTIDPEAARQRREKREADARREAEERERGYARAAVQAQDLWDAAQPVIYPSHPYLVRKGIRAPGKIRVGTYRRWYRGDDDKGGEIAIPDSLLIPIRDQAGNLTAVQAIFPDASNPMGRDRDYLPGARKQGCYFNIGKPEGTPGEVILIAEGYSTAATLAQCTERPAVVAMDAGNLAAVAAAIRAKLPQACLVICADNDQFLVGRDGQPYNPGVAAATKAALACGGMIAVPQFADLSGEPTDFNDLYLREGYQAVIDQVAAADYPRLEPEPAANDNAPADPARPPPVAAEFGQPIDVFGVAAPPELPLDVLPDCFQAYVIDQAQLTGCDPAIIGMGALVAAAACIDDAIKLQPKRRDPTWTEEARLWVAFVGDPSTKKSPAIAKAVRHVKRIDHRMAEKNDAAFADWKHQHESWKDAKKSDKSLPEPKQPGMQRLVVEDITVEALSDVLKDNPRGVLTLKDELTGWFASMDAYKGSSKGASMDRAHWLEAYQGGTHKIDRVTRGQIRVPNWSTCIIGGIQPDMIRRVANNMGNDGLLQRFMVIVARPAVEDEDRLPDMQAMKEFGELFDQLVALKAGTEPITLTEGAHECRLRVAALARRMITAFDHPHLQAWLGKWDGLFGRLLATYHIIECASEHVHPQSRMASQATAHKVERLMLGTLLHHAIHFYSEILDANERHEHVRQLARLILAKRFDRITKRDMTQLWKASRRMEWWELRAIIETLCTMDWLLPDPQSLDSDGRPRAWAVNPRVHEIFSTQAEREARRRHDAAETIREMREVYQGAR